MPAEQPVRVDLAAGRHAHAADSPPARSDRMSPNMFSMTIIQFPWLADHVERHRVDIAVAGFDPRVRAVSPNRVWYQT